MTNDKKNITRLIISFLLALILWAYATNETDSTSYKKFENIPIKMENTKSLKDNGYVVSIKNPAIKYFRIYGPTSSVKNVNEKDLIVKVDLNEVNDEGTYTLPILIEGLPNDVSINEQSAKNVKVLVEQKVSKTIQAPNVNALGETADGYSVINAYCEAKNVTVSGASSKIDKVSSISAQVDVTDKRDDFETNATLVALDKNNKKVSGVSVLPKDTKIFINIGKVKTVDVVVRTKGQVATGYKLNEVAPVVKTVKIAGDEDALASVNSIYTKKISIENKTESFTVNANLKFPNGISPVDNQTKVKVNLSIDEKGSKTISITSFKFMNLNKKFSANVVDDKVSVVLAGDDSVLKNITKDNLISSIDLSDIKKEGTYSKEIKISTQGLPSGVSIKSVDKSKVKVEITNKGAK